MEVALSRPAPIRLNAPLRWLVAGASDLRRSRFVGIAYGLAFVLMGEAIAWVYADLWQMTMGLTAGFFLLGPFVCCGLYELSRQLERGEPVRLAASAIAWRRNPKSIGFFAVILTFLMIVWARVSVVLFALFSTHDFPTLENVLERIASLSNLEFLLIWSLVGAVFAAIAFAISVVSVPMMLDRRSDTLEAVFESARAAWNNGLAMTIWAALIVACIAPALVWFPPALAVTAPIVGHATWHAYRELAGAP